MTRWFVIAMFCLTSVAGAADDAPVIDVWPGNAPGETGAIGPEHDKGGGGKLGAPVIRLADVSKPTLTIYRAKTDKPATTVLICPGGGYHILAWNLEGTEIAAWLNSIGVHAAVLKYRVPRRKGRPKHEAPLQDAQRAIRLLRHRADDYGIAPDRIGVLGFSAGGHLSAALSTNFDQPAYEAIDEADQHTPRPNFTVLIYPAYIAPKGKPTELADEITVTDKTPPAFIVQTQDDRNYIDSALGYYIALKEHDVPAEMHLYPEGGHGYGLRKSEHDVSTWPARCAAWMRSNGWINKD